MDSSTDLYYVRTKESRRFAYNDGDLRNDPEKVRFCVKFSFPLTIF